MNVAACRRCLIPRKCVATLPSLLRGQRGVPAAMSRERALLHYQACCADSGVSPRPCSANERYYILQHYSAASRVSLRPCPANERCYITKPVARTAACRRGRVPRTSVITFYNTIPRPAGCPCGHVPRTSVATLPSLLRGQRRCHSEPPRKRRVEESA